MKKAPFLVEGYQFILHRNKKPPSKSGVLRPDFGHNRNFFPEYWLYFFSLSSKRRYGCQVLGS